MSERDDFQSLDLELAAWREAWQTPERPAKSAYPANPPNPPKIGAEELAVSLRRQVRRRSLGLRWMTAGEAALTLTAIVVLEKLARSLGSPLDLFTLTTFAVLAACAFGFSLWNRWGIWRPSAESTAAYLELSLQRCRRRVRGLRAAWGLLALEVVLYLPWIGHRLRLKGETEPHVSAAWGAYGFLALVAAIAAAILLVLGRRTRREIEKWEEMRRSLLGEE